MDQKKTGIFIAKLRHDKGFTQQQLAEELGVTAKTVSRWENANYMPDISLLQRLAEVLGVSVTELLEGERKDTPRSKNQRIKKLLAVLLFVFRVIVLPLSFGIPTVAAWYLYITTAHFIPLDCELVWEVFRIIMVLMSTAWILLVNRLHARKTPPKALIVLTASALFISAFGIIVIEKLTVQSVWGTFEQLMLILMAYMVSRILAQVFDRRTVLINEFDF